MASAPWAVPALGAARLRPVAEGDMKYDPKEAVEILNAAGFRDTNGDGILDRNGQPLKVEIKTTPARRYVC